MAIMNLFYRKPPLNMRALVGFIDARFDRLNLRILGIMDELMKNLATANAEIRDRKTELSAMKAALVLANSEIATLQAAAGALPIGAMSADQVAAAVAASADLVITAAP